MAGAAVLAAAILVWSVVAVAGPRSGTGLAGGGRPVMRDELAAAPPGTPEFGQVVSVTDAAFHQDTWFVLDRRGARVHRIDGSGSLVGSYGRRGEGPGEFRRPSAISAHGDTVVVVDGDILRLFAADGDHIADRKVGLGSCGHGTVRDALSIATGLLFLVNCTSAEPVGWMVVHEPRDGPSRTLVVRARDPGVVDLGMTWAVLGAHPRGFVFGLPEQDCLGLFSPQGEALGQICHDWIERLPLPESIERTIVSLRERVRRSGVRLVETDRLPPFTRVFQVGNRIAYQTPLPERIEVFRLVTAGVSGGTVVFPLPPAEGLFAAEDSALLWWEDLEGTRIAIRTLDGSWFR